MSNKYSDTYGDNAAAGGEAQAGKFNLSKYDFELFDEEKNVPLPIIRVKRVNAKNEKWKIFTNDQLSFVIDGQRLTKKEKTFLRTLDGVSFLIAEFKKGFKTIAELKRRIKDSGVIKP